MQKIVAYPLSVLYYLLFGSSLLIFHVIQWLCLNVWGYNAHKKSVDALCFFLVANTYVLGTRYKIRNLNKLIGAFLSLQLITKTYTHYNHRLVYAESTS